jgi:hypothetical protein
LLTHHPIKNKENVRLHIMKNSKIIIGIGIDIVYLVATIESSMIPERESTQKICYI